METEEKQDEVGFDALAQQEERRRIMEQPTTVEESQSNETSEDESRVQEKLAKILNDTSGQEAILEYISFSSKRIERLHLRESNYAFLHLVEPLLRDKNVLDLFCGTNSLKQFSEQRNLGTTVTGVDNGRDNIYNDIESDVINLPTVLPPDGQFDIVTSFGGTESENYSNDCQYLKENGLLILGYSDSAFKESLGSQLGVEGGGKPEQLYRYFRPVAQINVNGIHVIADWPGQERPIDFKNNMVYLVLRKIDKVKV
ncbi:MAG: hypothetical protein WCI63_02070 [bacterium]